MRFEWKFVKVSKALIGIVDDKELAESDHEGE